MPSRRIRLRDLKAQAQALMASTGREVDDAGRLFATLVSEVLDGVTIKLVNQETGKAFRYGVKIDLLEGDEETP